MSRLALTGLMVMGMALTGCQQEKLSQTPQPAKSNYVVPATGPARGGVGAPPGGPPVTGQIFQPPPGSGPTPPAVVGVPPTSTPIAIATGGTTPPASTAVALPTGGVTSTVSSNPIPQAPPAGPISTVSSQPIIPSSPSAPSSPTSTVVATGDPAPSVDPTEIPLTVATAPPPVVNTTPIQTAEVTPATPIDTSVINTPTALTTTMTTQTALIDVYKRQPPSPACAAAREP